MGDCYDSCSISSDPSTHIQEGPPKRSQSPALPCRPAKRRHSWTADSSIARSCDEEERVANLARMYDRATWRMYDRIMTARARAAALRKNPTVNVPSSHQYIPRDNTRYISYTPNSITYECTNPSNEDKLTRESNHSVEFPFFFEMDH
eukprot:15346831-Ditylum_brightwellii.AAC.1